MNFKEFFGFKTIIFVLMFLLAIVLYSSKPIWVQKFVLGIEDQKFTYRSWIGKSPKANENIVIVTVDEKSVNEMGRWLWPRKTIAKLFENLSLASTVSLDMVFSEKSDEESDQYLADVISNNGNIILGYFLRGSGTENTKAEDFEYLDESSYTQFEQKSKETKLKDFPYAEINIPLIMGTGAPSAFFNAVPDEDGLYRKYPLVFLHKGVYFPPLAVQTYRFYKNMDAQLVFDKEGLTSFKIDNFEQKNTNYMRLNFYDDVKYVSASDVIFGRIKPEFFEGKNVIVGVTEVGIYDMRPTPMNPITPGVSLHYVAFSNMLNNEPLYENPTIDYTMLVVVFFIILALSFMKKQSLRLFSYGFLLFFVFAVSYYFFISHNYWQHEFYVFLPALFLIMIFETNAFFKSEEKAKEIKKAFSSYVSPDLVEEILKDPDRLELGGEEREISIMFSDIRGFTSLSETLTPTALVSMLNSIHDPMTNVILQKKGMLDKYIGDAMMCLFNTPVDLPNHPDIAVESALELIRVLHQINEGFKQKNLPIIDVGVGVNTGLAVCGNMGSKVRFEYTAIGDSVNLASRLEGLCKVYKCRIVLSEFTVHKLTQDFLLRKLDRVRVKGKHEPVEIFEAMEKTDENKTIQAEYDKALHLYFDKKFEEAFSIFNKLVTEMDDRPSTVFTERCEHFMSEPPEDGWDGVFTLKSK